MRDQQERTGSLFSYLSIEDRIPASHPLRRIRKLADQALNRLNPIFCQLYASEGRPSVPPEQLLLASLLQAFYGIRSERLLLEKLGQDSDELNDRDLAAMALTGQAFDDLADEPDLYSFSDGEPIRSV